MMDTDFVLTGDILVIDDSAVVLGIVKRILEKRYNVRIAQSAKNAYLLIEEELPDLILLDLEMPEIDGFMFLESIISNPDWKDIPVIFLTSADDRKKEERALELGAVEYILKPISEGVLIKRVHFHLELRYYHKKLEDMVASRTEELLRTQEELRKVAETAKEALRVKTTFLANMSHEIRTPMNSIMGFSELALEKNIDIDTRNYFLKIKDSTILLLRIINDILDISKIEAGKLYIECISFNPGNVLSNCETMVLPLIEEKELEFIAEIDESLTSMQTMGDPVRLYQAILNLLSNAAKFTKSGFVKLSASLLNSDDENATIRFEVEDSGIGMTEEQTASVFEPFVQVDSNSTRAQDGTGLGLPITKNIVELMGGTLSVESTPDVGSKFSIELTFPVTDADSLFDDVFGPNVPSDIEKPIFKGEVLVCEDNRMNQQVIREHLSRVGLDCVIGDNGLEGLKIIMKRMKEGKPLFDLILMDMQMPVMDGFEATARINALGTGIPIVALTANVMSTDIENYKKSGLWDCIGKPFQTWDLWRCLLGVLEPVTKTVIDVNALSKRDEDLRKKLMLNFPNENRDRIENIRIAIAENDIKKARLLVHTLKSNAGLINEPKLQSIAASLERKLEAGDIDYVVSQMNSLEFELKSVLKKLDSQDIKSKIRDSEPEGSEGSEGSRGSEKPDKTDKTDKKQPGKANIPEEKKSVLIVDDEKSNIIALTHILRDEFNVFVTRDSSDAMSMAEEQMPDIILLDILMPEPDGYEVIALLKDSDKTRNIPVVFISGLVSPEAVEKGLSSGAAGYIPKPFDSFTVTSKIKELLSNRDN